MENLTFINTDYNSFDDADQQRILKRLYVYFKYLEKNYSFCINRISVFPNPDKWNPTISIYGFTGNADIRFKFIDKADTELNDDYLHDLFEESLPAIRF